MVLFSGGLDSTILAALLCEVLPAEIGLDLVNVSMRPDDAPDRITSILSFYELAKRRKNIRLICADYAIEEIMANQRIHKLIAPKSSHMDFNIASALHYASKGEGTLFDTAYYESNHFKEILAKLESRDQGQAIDSKSSYDFGLLTNTISSIPPELYYSNQKVKSTSKVVFSGLGADEVWSGYSRYKTALLKSGTLGL